MAYNAFDAAKPVITDSRQDVVDKTRYNLTALRDALIMGAMPGFNYSYVVGTGSADEPQYMYYKNGNTWVRVTITWGTTGGEDGNPTQELWALSTDGGSNYDTIKTIAYTWDASGRLTSTTHS